MATKDWTWTEHTSRCRTCGRLFRIAREVIDDYKREADEPVTDAEIVNTIDVCLQCTEGVTVPEENVWEYETGISGNYILDSRGEVVCEFPDESPVFTGNEFNPTSLRSLADVLHRLARQAEAT
jgi:hypothetical protein